MNHQTTGVIGSQRQNVKLKILWLIGKLLFNIMAWGMLTALFFFMVSLLKPDIGENGARFFQLIYQHKILIVLLSSSIATFSWLVEDVLFFRFLAGKSIGIVFLFRLLFLVSLVTVVFLAVSAYHYHHKIFTDIEEYLILLKWFFINRTTVFLFLTAAIISAIINLLKAIRQKVGAYNFLRIVSGYYRKPREEERIFIFIDLISSTQFAEQLGHRKYSAFLQKCFQPLGLLEIKYRAMQYQIIGDEVVLTWTTSDPRNFRFAVKFYYEYIFHLQAQASHFQKEFGIIPKFSASINSGKIMVSEVGSVKSEIAFHGDVLNTAARIQKQCKSYKKQLLVTKTFAEQFSPVSDGFKVERLAREKLIGKEKYVEIYAIDLETPGRPAESCYEASSPGNTSPQRPMP